VTTTDTFKLSNEPFPATSDTAGDEDGDGNPDLLVAVTLGGQSGRFVIIHGNGDGTFRTSSAPDELTSIPNAYPNQGYPGALVDLDGDGLADIWMTGIGGGGDLNQIFWNDGGGHFSPGPPEFPMAIGDFDADGRPDYYTNSNTAVLAVHNGPRSFVRYPLPPLVALQSNNLADLDGDGATDFVIVYKSQSTSTEVVTGVYLSTAKHPGPAHPDIHCGMLAPADCDGPLGF